MCEPPPNWSCRIVPPGTAARVRCDVTTLPLSCSCCLNLEALFSEGPPCPPLPLSRCELHELLLALPRQLQNSPWNVCFDTDHDGFSLHYFYRMMKRVHDCGQRGIGVFVVANNEPESECSSTADELPTTPTRNDASVAQPVVFGCFTPEVPCLGHSQHAFFGTPDTFVFTYADVSRDGTRHGNRTEQRTPPSAFSCDGEAKSCSDDSADIPSPLFPPLTSLGPFPRILSAYPWATEGANKEFMVCANDFFGIGGGRDGAAIFVDGDLLHGTSSVDCATFASPSLCGRAPKTLRHSEFMILRMVWFSVKERKDNFTCMHLPESKPCDCGRFLKTVDADRTRGLCLSSVAHKSGGWHVCSEEQQQQQYQ